jgi:uncharacterized membrane protein YidH (DUF202 family)
MKPQSMIGAVLVVVGIILLIMGVSAADSFSSRMSRFFTGEVTDRAMLLMIGGALLILIGGGTAVMSGRALKR